MSPPARRTASALGARMRNVTRRSAATSGETTRGPWGPRTCGAFAAGCADAADSRTNVASIVAAASDIIILRRLHRFSPSCSRCAPTLGRDGGRARPRAAGAGAIALEMRLRNSTSTSASWGVEDSQQTLPCRLAVRPQLLIDSAAPRCVSLTLRARRSVGCCPRVTSPRLSKPHEHGAYRIGVGRGPADELLLRDPVLLRQQGQQDELIGRHSRAGPGPPRSGGASPSRRPATPSPCHARTPSLDPVKMYVYV